MTPHNEAKKRDIAKTVLMPGDPLRAKYIANKYLKDVKLVNSIRNMLAYTGYYKGKRITIFASGMGMPSMGIYCYELFKFYDVQNIIRIGSGGAYSPDLDLFDIILVNKSYTLGNFSLALTGEEHHISSSSNYLNDIIRETANQNKIQIIEGNTLCSEVFDYYCDLEKLVSMFPKDIKLIAAEMEAFALFSTAQLFGRNASCLLSIVDSHSKKQKVSAKKREQFLNEMIELALNSTLKL